jgi:hypothetical protein
VTTAASPTQGNRLEVTERRVAFALAASTAAAVLGQFVPQAVSKGSSRDAALAALGLALAGALAVAARFGHRIVTAFAAVLASFAPQRYAAGVILSFACLAYGGWIMIKASRVARERAEERRRDRAAAKADEAGAAGARGSSGGRGRRSRASRAGPAATRSAATRSAATRAGSARSAAGAAGRARPGASSRYTPPAKKRRPRATGDGKGRDPVTRAAEHGDRERDGE